MGDNVSDLQKALELMLSVPHRAIDNKFLANIEGYKGDFHDSTEAFLTLITFNENILGNIHKLGRLLTHEWWTVVDKEGKSKERYLFLFKARILICKVRRISDDRSVFILKEIVRLPETEVKDSEENKIEIKSADEVIVLTAHKEETKKFWLKEIKQYITDVVALQEHSLDDLKIDPKQHLDNVEPVIKLPHRIEAHEPNQNIKPSDFAEDYTISKYSTTKASEEIKSKTTKETVGEKSEETITTVKKESSQVTQETVEVKEQKASQLKEQSKIPVLKKTVEEKPTQKAELVKTEPVKKPEEKVAAPVKVAEPKVPEKPKEVAKVEEKSKATKVPTQTVEEKPKKVEEKSLLASKPVEAKVEEKPKVLPELKTEIVRKSSVGLQSVVSQPIEKSSAKEVKAEQEKPKEVKSIAKEEKLPEKPKEPVKSELSEAEASVSEKLEKLSQKLRAIRKTETDKEVTKFVPKEVTVTESEKTEEDLRKQEAIRESIQDKIDEDYISESSVIKRIEERYKRNYKDKEIKTSSKRKPSVDLEENLRSLSKKEVKVESEPKPKKTALPPLSLTKEIKPVEKKPEITKAADSDKSSDKLSNQPPPQDNSQSNQSDNQSGAGQENPDRGSSSNQNNQSGGSRRSDKEPSPPSPGAIRLPGFFDPPPPTQYETSVEIHVKQEKYPDPPPKITRKVVVKNEELERKTEEFLRGEIAYEKEDFSLGAAHKKIKNLKHNLGKTGDNIKFAEDTVSKARVGDFKHIKTPGTVVPERKKEPVFEYQYTVEDPKTGVCITTSEAVDFEDAEEELKKLAEMEAEHKNTITKRVEGMIANQVIYFPGSIIFTKLEIFL